MVAKIDTGAPERELSEELALFRTMARRFCEREVVPNRDRWRVAKRVDVASWREAGRVGLLCAGIPEDWGGGGGDFRHEAVLMEELARVGFIDFGMPQHNAIVAPYVLQYGTEAQKRRWLPRMATGELIGAIAMTEPGAGSDLQAIRTSARLKDGRRVLSGQKTFITNGQNANLICVAAKTDPAAGAKGVSLFMVETDGLERFRRGRNLDKVGLKGQDTSELFFDDVELPADALLGDAPNQGFAQLMQQLPQERLVIAVQAVASIEAAFEETIRYVRERMAFGKRILDFQNTQFEMAEIKTEMTIARVFLDHCIDELVNGRLDAVKAAMAKYWTTDKQCELIDRCLQLFGGYGVMEEYAIARMWTDARVQRIYGGTNEIMKVVIARSL